VLRHVPDTRFLIAGEGDLRSALVDQIEKERLQKHVVLTGFRLDALSLLKAFDVFVMSSITEGLGTSLLDAMACSKAIVATRAGGIPEVVVDGETGFLVPVRDPSALADRIVRLLTDEPQRTAFGRAGRVRAEQRFSAERMVAETLAIYDRLAGRSRAADTTRPAAADQSRTD
jgi:glycosyltransferase involved in cell wall biosynthesis